MDRLVKIDAVYLGRLLREASREYEFRFEVCGEDKKNWQEVKIPVEFSPKTRTFDPVLDPSIQPLSVDLTDDVRTANNKKYEGLVLMSNSNTLPEGGELIPIRIPKEMKYYRVITRCPRCEQIYPSDRYGDRYTEDGYFIISSGEISGI